MDFLDLSYDSDVKLDFNPTQSVSVINNPTIVLIKEDINPILKVASLYSKFSQDTYSKSVLLKVISDTELEIIYKSGIIYVSKVVSFTTISTPFEVGLSLVVDLFSFNKMLNFVSNSLVLFYKDNKLFIHLYNGVVNIPLFSVSIEYYLEVTKPKYDSFLSVTDKKFIDCLLVFNKLSSLGVKVEDKCVNIDKNGIYLNTSTITAVCPEFSSSDLITLQRMDIESICVLLNNYDNIKIEGNSQDLVLSTDNVYLKLPRKKININFNDFSEFNSLEFKHKFYVDSKSFSSILYLLTFVPQNSGLVYFKSLGNGVRIESFNRSGDEISSFDVLGKVEGEFKFSDLSYSLNGLRSFFNSFDGQIIMYVSGNKVFVKVDNLNIVSKIELSFK